MLSARSICNCRRLFARSGRVVLCASFFLGVTGMASGQGDAGDAGADVVGEAGQDGADAVAPKIDHIPTFETDGAAREKAREVFEASVAAYRKTTAIRDQVTIRSISTYAGNSGEDSFEVPMLIAEDALWIKLNENKFTVVDNTVYGEFAPEANRLYIRDFEGRISVDLFLDILYLFPIVHIPMRYADDPLENLFLANVEPKIVGYRRVYLAEEDAEFDEIRISSEGDGAPLELRFDAETGLIARFRTELRDPNMNEMDGTEILVDFHAEVLDELPIDEFITELENRREVDSLGALSMPPNIQDLVHKPSPNFKLDSIDGESIHSETLAGNVIVLAFWQVEYEDLLPVLPAMNELTEWRDGEGKSVEIFAVNAGDPIDILRTLWNEREYVSELLLDPELDTAREIYKIGILPTIIIISADGVIDSVLSNFEFDDDVPAMLKKSVIRALNKGI